MKNLNLMILFFFIFHLTTVWAGGNEVGDGTDYPSQLSSIAWFVTDTNKAQTKFRYCYVASNDFGADAETIETSISKALSIWSDYIREKNARVFYENRQIVYRGELQPACDGSEDLKLYFGIETPEIEKEKLRYNEPTAFTLRSSYDVDQTWGKGLLWVARQGALNPGQPFPNWAQKETLTGILIHEIGHILGCQHMTGTIMDVDLAGFISAGIYPIQNLLKIDYKRELVLSDQSPSYKGDFGDVETPNFQIFFEREPQGLVRAQYSSESENAFLLVSDGIATQSLPLKRMSYRVPIESSVTLFKIAFRGTQGIEIQSTPVTAYIETGFISTRGGKTFEFSKEVNLEKSNYENFEDENCGPLNLRYKDEGKLKTLFRSHPL